VKKGGGDDEGAPGAPREQEHHPGRFGRQLARFETMLQQSHHSKDRKGKAKAKVRRRPWTTPSLLHCRWMHSCSECQAWLQQPLYP
jgi:hypothetical protein